jgi:uncharacterized protein
MTFEALAFFTGLFGSLHCISMCGPLMLALPFSRESLWISVLQRFLYQAGRVLMYGFLGLILGLLGKGFSLLGLQQVLSLLTGTLLLIAGINHFVKVRTTRNKLVSSKLIGQLTRLLGKYLSKPYGAFVAGSLNGLLPCGLTYIALAQAINLNTAFESSRSMLFFGLGTLPLIFLTALSPLFFRKFKTPGMLVPILFIIAGSFLMARGLNIEIPYVSHAINIDGTIGCK